MAWAECSNAWQAVHDLNRWSKQGVANNSHSTSTRVLPHDYLGNTVGRPMRHRVVESGRASFPYLPLIAPFHVPKHVGDKQEPEAKYDEG